MKLIKAHVQNFGKLSNLDIDFSDGLNSFIHENGWGKTTLSVFIKSMFYGMEHTTSKDIEKNEKLKYAPWQGGLYGGTLMFSHSDKTYIIRRTFGLKKNEDTFELRDVKTNKISTDFSKNIGNELFGINRETYGRSVYVVLDESPVASDDISAKLNNLVEAADISSFDTAVTSLDKKTTALKAKRGNNGEISQIQNNIEEDRNALIEIESKILQNESYEKKIGEINKTIEELKKNARQFGRTTCDKCKV
ncbi:MAG: AAA family ATPase, partial [Treponema sp.]|nr:AAA family ATPase [Treponema sp.]